MIGAKLIEAAGNGISTVAVAEAIDFDGTNDYLSRSTDLTGSADSKTFTFSCWIWQDDWSNSLQIYVQTNTSGLTTPFVIFSISSGSFNVSAYNSAGTEVLNASVASVANAARTFTHILVSVDLASTSNRAIYINDVAQSVTWTTYTNSAIDFTQLYRGIGARPDGTVKNKTRLSNVYLDYTYRDLSIEANRRLFVTADLKPAAGQAALNPILYLPMDDPTQPGLNAGTGGNFTLTGTVARSGRGPNQYNAPYSDLDGSADYLERTTALTGVTDTKTFTISFCVNADATGYPISWGAPSTTTSFTVFVYTNRIDIYGYTFAGASVLVVSANFPAGTLSTQRNLVITASIDMANTSNRHVYVNGQATTNTWSTYVNQTIGFTRPNVRFGRSMFTDYYNGRIGAFWFDTSYIDLSVAANLAKFVTGTGIDAKPVDLGANGELPTGTSPLIYLPMYGNNAGKNYGTGGDFTVNSGPYTGARGPNEFWGNIADFGGITSGSYLNKNTSLGTSDGKTASLSFWIRPDSATTRYVFTINPSDGSTTHFGIEFSSNLRLQISGGGLGVTTANSSIPLNAWKHVLVYFDLTDSSKRGVYINGVLATVTWNSYTNTNILFSSPNVVFAARNANYADTFDGKLSEFYFTTDYIDFSQEANRLKFRDAFGNPVDLTQQIQAAAIPTPAIYMRFPPTSFGTNSGTGGNFTVNGTITDGGQL